MNIGIILVVCMGIYKIYTTLVRRRVQAAVEHKISSTQYGFRPRRSTAHAAYIIRRLQDWSEQKSGELHLALLDWNTAFDKVQPATLIEAMRRRGFTQKYLEAIKNLYVSPMFYIQDDYGTSTLKRQSTGIRQGCILILISYDLYR